MKHHPTVLKGPIRTAYELCSDKTVLDEQLVIGERILIKEMAKSFIESLITFVSNRKEAILNAECSFWILSEFISTNLRHPAGQITSIEERYPVITSQ